MRYVIVLALLAVNSVLVASDDSLVPLSLSGRSVWLTEERFRSREEQDRLLTRKDQILNIHSGDVGMSLRRRMSPVKDQGPRPSCSAFATIAILEGFTGEDYSEQCLLRFSSDKDPGFIHERLAYIQQNGVYYEADCPYDLSQRDNIPSLTHAVKREFAASFESYPFEESDPISYLKSRLAVESPVGISFFVVGKSQWSTGPFIYLPEAQTIALECGFSSGCGSHAVIVTGLNDTLGLIEFKNSWGTDWGNGGYGYMSYDYFLTFAKGRMISY